MNEAHWIFYRYQYRTPTKQYDSKELEENGMFLISTRDIILEKHITFPFFALLWVMI